MAKIQLYTLSLFSILRYVNMQTSYAFPLWCLLPPTPPFLFLHVANGQFVVCCAKREDIIPVNSSVVFSFFKKKKKP